MRLYHATPLKNLENICAEGLHPGSYWSSNEDILDYYAETITDEGDDVAILVIDLQALGALCTAKGVTLEPDHAGIEEPITTVLRKAEAKVQEEWLQSAQGWQDSLSIVGSLRCPLPLQALDLRLLNQQTDETDALLLPSPIASQEQLAKRSPRV